MPHENWKKFGIYVVAIVLIVTLACKTVDLSEKISEIEEEVEIFIETEEEERAPVRRMNYKKARV